MYVLRFCETFILLNSRGKANFFPVFYEDETVFNESVTYAICVVNPLTIGATNVGVLPRNINI